ncbi:MAG: hypothetical protein ACW963_08885 [Candidatus Sifarchaeia archaeon]|jgi:hypothetical protein
MITRKYQINAYNIIFVSPDWASGLDCIDNCGYCCLSELPANVPKKREPRINATICAHYDLSNRLCLKYNDRPFMCKLFPLITGIKGEELIISAMLGCPGTNTKAFDISLLEKGLKDSNFPFFIENSRRNFQPVLTDDLWQHIDPYFENTKNDLIALIKDIGCFPKIDNSMKLFNENLEKRFHFPKNIFKSPNMRYRLSKDIRKSGVYIATRFNSFNCINVTLRGNRVTMTTLNGKRKKFQLEQRQLPLTQDAIKMLEDYISFQFERPLLFMTGLISVFYKRRCTASAIDVLWSIMNTLDIGFSLISLRDRLSEVDRDSLREIISFVEPSIHGMYLRPDRGYMVN